MRTLCVEVLVIPVDRLSRAAPAPPLTCPAVALIQKTEGAGAARKHHRCRRHLLLLITCIVASTACSGGTETSGDSGVAEPTLIRVSAASSLTAPFTALGAEFESAHPEADVVFTFDSSGVLVQHMADGAPVDLLATADVASMERAVAASGTDMRSTIFATNRLAILVERGNPLGIASLDDLVSDDVTVIRCANSAPCGALADRMLAKAGADISFQSLEPTAAAVTNKVRLGEADAGLTFATEGVASEGATEVVELPEGVDAVSDYPMAVAATGSTGELARAFADFVLSDDGQRVLADFGFGPPPP